MRSKQRSQMIQYADRILGALNLVEILRENACSGHDFGPESEKAVNLWRTAQAMEEAIIRENGLPNLQAILYKIMDAAESGMGFTGGPIVPSYMKSAFAIWEVEDIIRQAITPKLRILIDIIRADGFDLRYYPVDQMVNPKPPSAAGNGPKGGAA